VSSQGIAVLHDLNRVRAGLAVIAMGINHPCAGHVGWGTILGELLAETYMAQSQQQEGQQSKK
jgi:hypothetical protein